MHYCDMVCWWGANRYTGTHRHTHTHCTSDHSIEKSSRKVMVGEGATQLKMGATSGHVNIVLQENLFVQYELIIMSSHASILIIAWYNQLNLTLSSTPTFTRHMKI